MGKKAIMRLHFKIDSNKLSDNGLLLDGNALITISSIESFVKSLAEDSDALLQDKAYLHAINEKLFFVNDPYQAIDSILIPKEDENETVYQHRVLQQLAEWESQFNSPDTIDFILTLKSKFSLAEKHNYETYSNYLNEVWEQYETDAQDLNLARKLEESREKIEGEIELKKSYLKSAIDKFQNENKVLIDLDDKYQLVKISKKSQNLPFSILYINQGNETKPVALYPGKDGQILGEGGFGRVKLGQNILTGEWVAVKIQSQFMQSLSQNENQILSDFKRFKGEARRESKYYSAQTLIYGSNLYEYLQQNPDTPFEKRLLIAEKAAHLVDVFHDNYLHRDLKPENFIWDDEENELYLCDFGMSLRLDANQKSISGLSGSGTYLAPEIDESHKGNVYYTKKSDMYALGKVFNSFFEETTPLPEDLENLIKNMTAHNPKDRMDSAKEVCDILREINDKTTNFRPGIT
jgi:hypothetical protein